MRTLRVTLSGDEIPGSAAAATGAAIEGLALEAHPEQEVSLVASVPLSDEAWQPLAEGEVVALRGGRLLARVSVARAPRPGR